MKKYLIIICLLNFSNQVFSQRKSLMDEILITTRGTKISEDSLRKGIWVFLISTYECGYCIKDIPFNNSLRKKFLGKVNFITLFELDTTKIKKYELNNNPFLEWEKIPNASIIYERYWKFGAFPEFLIYKNGKKMKVLSDASLKTKTKLEKYLKKII